MAVVEFTRPSSRSPLQRKLRLLARPPSVKGPRRGPIRRSTLGEAPFPAAVEKMLPSSCPCDTSACQLVRAPQCSPMYLLSGLSKNMKTRTVWERGW